MAIFDSMTELITYRMKLKHLSRAANQLLKGMHLSWDVKYKFTQVQKILL